MAHQQYNHQYPPPQNGQYPPPVQTQNLHQYQQQQQQRAPYSPPSSYQQSPTAMSPNMGGGVPPAKRQRLSPNPPSPSPYQSPFAASPYPQSQPQSPYATSPQYPMSMPASPAAHQPPPFHQPQPYQQANAMNQHAASQGSMPPPKVPASKAQDDTLEKSNPRDLDVNNLSDVLSGGIVDLRAEEEMLLHSYSNRGQGASFNSQLSGSSAPPGGSFNWSQQGGHGAYQGSGPMSQTLTADQHEAELLRKHEQAARILNESSQHPLTDPFIAANVLRHRIAKRAYDTGISVNVDGLFDKIPEKNPRDVERRVRDGANGEQVVGLEAASLLNQNAPLVDIIALLTLAAEERVRTIIEDAYALSQGRQHTSHGIIPPQMVDIAVIEKDAESKGETPVNILKTPWESTEVVSSPIAVANKQPQSAARLPTPPSEAPPTPKPTYQNVNHVARTLKRKIDDDEKFEKERLKRREKRRKGDEATIAEAPVKPIVIPEKMSKRDKEKAKAEDMTDAKLRARTNATASMALGFGKKKKYSWMTGGDSDAPASGTSTPKTTAVAAAGSSGTATPAAAPAEDKLTGKKRTYGKDIEKTKMGTNIQIRDLVHVLENDGHERKTLSRILARLKNTEKDDEPADQRAAVGAGR